MAVSEVPVDGSASFPAIFTAVMSYPTLSYLMRDGLMLLVLRGIGISCILCLCSFNGWFFKPLFLNKILWSLYIYRSNYKNNNKFRRENILYAMLFRKRVTNNVAGVLYVWIWVTSLNKSVILTYRAVIITYRAV